jgi:hypothetical protein
MEGDTVSGSTENNAGIKSSTAKPVPPDAVRVWRGFRLAKKLTPDQFVDELRTIFIPATAQLQRLYGLTAYLPTVLPKNKPEVVPDEIALVFYESQQAYNDTKQIVVGRAYSLLHETVFAFPASQSGFPDLLGSSAFVDNPYHLFTGSVDWQEGFTQVFVGTRQSSTSPQEFLSRLQLFFQEQQRQAASGFDGGVFCISSNWVLYWEHWESERASQIGGRISQLPKLAERVLLQTYVPQKIDSSLTAHYSGLRLEEVDSKSLNILF